MAVESIKDKVVLRLEYDGGEFDGKTKVIKNSYSKIKIDSLDAELYDVATAIAGLQTKELLNVVRNDEMSLKTL